MTKYEAVYQTVIWWNYSLSGMHLKYIALHIKEFTVNIGLLISVFHIGLVIASRSVVLAWGEAEGQYDRPRRNN